MIERQDLIANCGYTEDDVVIREFDKTIQEARNRGGEMGASPPTNGRAYWKRLLDFNKCSIISIYNFNKTVYVNVSKRVLSLIGGQLIHELPPVLVLHFDHRAVEAIVLGLDVHILACQLELLAEGAIEKNKGY